MERIIVGNIINKCLVDNRESWLFVFIPYTEMQYWCTHDYHLHHLHTPGSMDDYMTNDLNDHDQSVHSLSCTQQLIKITITNKQTNKQTNRPAQTKTKTKKWIPFIIFASLWRKQSTNIYYIATVFSTNLKGGMDVSISVQTEAFPSGPIWLE